MGGMGGKGGGGYGEIAVISHGMWVVEGCGGMWLRGLGQNGRKLGETWEKHGTKYPQSHVPHCLTVPFV